MLGQEVSGIGSSLNFSHLDFASLQRTLDVELAHFQVSQFATGTYSLGCSEGGTTVRPESWQSGRKTEISVGQLMDEQSFPGCPAEPPQFSIRARCCGQTRLSLRGGGNHRSSHVGKM